MHWQDTGIILSLRPLGEHNAILTLLTEMHGKAKGVARSIQSKKNRGLYQIGNRITCEWSARLADQLGSFSCELSAANTALILSDAIKLNALTSACTLCDITLAEHEDFSSIYKQLEELINKIIYEKEWMHHYVHFEYMLLHSLGFGLDLSECAATGTTENLRYVSPKTGRAVCEESGLEYHNKLLKLPNFLTNTPSLPITHNSIIEGLTLTGYFLDRHTLAPHNRSLPAVRTRLLESIWALL